MSRRDAKLPQQVPRHERRRTCASHPTRSAKSSKDLRIPPAVSPISGRNERSRSRDCFPESKSTGMQLRLRSGNEMRPSPPTMPLFCVLASAGGFLLLAGGCSDGLRTSEAEALAPREPDQGGEFHMMLESPGTLDPAFADDVYETCITNQIFDGLLEFDADLHPVPCIAKEWTVSRDGTTYVFVLRDDVRFHNGRRVVAHDFVESFQRIVDPRDPDVGI